MTKLQKIKESIARCDRCRLYKTRKNTVPGVGPASAKVMIIGEAPGAEENIMGFPFIGRSGMLLRETLEKARLEVPKLFIHNMVSCRPPENRNPLSDEVDACEIYLKRKIQLIKPKIIILVGAIPTKYILLDEELDKLTFSEVRNKTFQRVVFGVRTTLVPIYHPAYILRNQNLKDQYLRDLKEVKRLLT